MKYHVIDMLVWVVTIALLVLGFNGMILPVMGPKGFFPTMGVAMLFGFAVVNVADHLIDRIYDYLQKDEA